MKDQRVVSTSGTQQPSDQRSAGRSDRSLRPVRMTPPFARSMANRDSFGFACQDLGLYLFATPVHQEEKVMYRFSGAGVSIALAVLVCLITLTGCKPGSRSLSDEEKAEAQAYLDKVEAERKAEEAALLKELKWQYETDTNAMGATNSYASVKSINDINLASPYTGAQKGKIVVRHHSEHGKDVLFSVEKGQIHGDQVTVRFDDEKAFSMPFTEPADGSSELIFLSYSKLIGKLRTAKKMALQVMFYDNGNQIFEFDVSGLDMTKLN